MNIKFISLFSFLKFLVYLIISNGKYGKSFLSQKHIRYERSRYLPANLRLSLKSHFRISSGRRAVQTMLAEVMLGRVRHLVFGQPVSREVAAGSQGLNIPETRIIFRRLLGDGGQLSVVQVLDGRRVLGRNNKK